MSPLVNILPDNARLLANKLRKGRIWQRILRERATEPLHLNIASLFVLAFGSYRAKIDWDLVVSQPYAFGVLKAADLARKQGLDAVTVVEFGVASGSGLMNLATLAERVTAETGVRFEIHGFDTGSGMPPALDFRDHPELYQQGDFVMDVEGLRAILPSNVMLHLGELSETIPAFLDGLEAYTPIGFVSMDVDYYSSTVQALELLKAPPERYLPWLPVYADDISLSTHNSKAGELLAFAEFNASNADRNLEAHAFFEKRRIFQRAIWVRQMLFLHVLDHPRRTPGPPMATKRYIENPYLKSELRRERFDIGD